MKFTYNGQERFGEVQYFTRLAMNAMTEALLKISSHTLISSKLLDELVVVHVKSLKSVVGMIPHRLRHPSEDRFFLMEKPGLDILQLGIPYSVYQDDDDLDPDIK